MHYQARQLVRQVEALYHEKEALSFMEVDVLWRRAGQYPGLLKRDIEGMRLSMLRLYLLGITKRRSFSQPGLKTALHDQKISPQDILNASLRKASHETGRRNKKLIAILRRIRDHFTLEAVLKKHFPHILRSDANYAPRTQRRSDPHFVPARPAW